jgi:hypothetical protein
MTVDEYSDYILGFVRKELCIKEPDNKLMLFYNYVKDKSYQNDDNFNKLKHWIENECDETYLNKGVYFSESNTLIGLSAWGNCPELTEILLENEASPCICFIDGEYVSPINAFFHHGNMDGIKLMIKWRVDVEECGFYSLITMLINHSDKISHERWCKSELEVLRDFIQRR